MPDRIDTYNRYRGTIKNLLLLSGLWPVVNPSGFYRLVPYVHVSAELWLIWAILNFSRVNMRDFELLITSLGFGLGFLIGAQKIIWLTRQRDRLLDMETSLGLLFSQDLKDPELRPILLSPLLEYYRPSLIFAIIAYTLCALYVITPVIVIIVELIQGASVIEWNLPVPAVYPWSIGPTNLSFYLILYIYETYVGLCIASVASSVDGLFGYYIFQIGGQLRVMSHRLRNLKANDNYQKVIRECVDRHQILARCQEHLEKIYGPIVLCITMLNAMVMCAFIFQLSRVNPKKAVSLIVFIVAKAVQTLFYGWFGSTLTTEIDKFREAIYATDWPGSGKQSLMTSILTMMSCNKPFVLKACSVSTISVDMFVAVCNTAASYYFMLRSVEEHKNKIN